MDVRGINNHEITSILLVTAGGINSSHNGNVFIIIHQYAYHGRGKKIHSSGQIEWYENDVNDKSIKVGSKQRILTNYGYIFPLSIKDGLPYLKLRPYTDDTWEDLPYIILTSDINWDHSILDYEFNE